MPKRKKQSKTKSHPTPSRRSAATSVPTKPISAPPGAEIPAREVIPKLKRPPKSLYLPIVKAKYGREPRKGEVIHHLDENPSNNNSSNLVILPKWVHWVLHTWQRLGWLETYRDDIVASIEELRKKNATGT